MGAADSVVLEIRVDDKGTPVVRKFKGEVEGLGKTVPPATAKAESGFKSLWKQVALGSIAYAGVSAAVAAAGATISGALRASIDAEETHNKLLVVFSDHTDRAAQAVKNLAQNYGMSRLEAETMLSATGDLVTGLGMAQDKALSLSERTQMLAADLASFQNYAGGAAGASEALTKAMLGEREMLKGLGIVIHEAMITERLRAQGLDKLTGMALQEAKAEATLAIAMEQSKNAMGDFARTQDSAANMGRQVSAAFQDMQIELGKVISEITRYGSIMVILRDGLRGLTGWLEENKASIVGVADALRGMVGFVFDVTASIGTLIKTPLGWLIEFKEIVLAIVGVSLAATILTWGAAVAKLAVAVKGLIAMRLVGMVTGVGTALFNLGAYVGGPLGNAIGGLGIKIATMSTGAALALGVIGIAAVGAMYWIQKKNEALDAAIAKIKREAIEEKKAFDEVRGSWDQMRESLSSEDFEAAIKRRNDLMQQGMSLAQAAKKVAEETFIIPSTLEDDAEAASKALEELEASGKSLSESFVERVKTEVEGVKKARDAWEQYAASLGIITRSSIPELERKAGSLARMMEQYRGQMNASSDLQKKMWEEAGALIRQYEQINKKVPDRIYKFWKEGLWDRMQAASRQSLKAILGMEIKRPKTDAELFFGQTDPWLASGLGSDTHIKWLEDIGLGHKTAADEAKDLKFEWQQITAFGQVFRDSLSGISQLAGLVGIKLSGVTNSMGSIFQGIQGIAGHKDVASQLSKSIGGKTGELLGSIGGALSLAGGIGTAISGAVGLFKSIGSLFKGKSGERKAIDRITGDLGLSKDFRKQLEEEAKALGGSGSAERAMNNHLAELISTMKGGREEMDRYARKVRDIWAVHEWANVSLEETTANYEASYLAMMKQVQGTGKLSAGYIDLIRQSEALKAEGIALTDIEKAKAEAMQAGLQGYKDYLEAQFSPATIAVFEDLLAREKALAEHEDIVRGVKGLETALMNLSSAAVVTEDQFSSFSTAALDGFQAMINDGLDSNYALEQIGPTLSRLIELSNLYGFTIDDATQALIDQAKEAGVSLEKQVDPQREMLDVLKAIAEVLGAKLPAAVRSMADTFRSEFSGIGDIVRETGGAIDDVLGKSYGHQEFNPGQGQGKIPGFATGTKGWITAPTLFLAGENGPEYYQQVGRRIKIDPASQGNAVTGSRAPSGPLRVDINQVHDVRLHVTGEGAGQINTQVVGDLMTRLFKQNDGGHGERVAKEIGRHLRLKIA